MNHLANLVQEAQEMAERNGYTSDALNEIAALVEKGYSCSASREQFLTAHDLGDVVECGPAGECKDDIPVLVIPLPVGVSERHREMAKAALVAAHEAENARYGKKESFLRPKSDIDAAARKLAELEQEREGGGDG